MIFRLKKSGAYIENTKLSLEKRLPETDIFLLKDGVDDKVNERKGMKTERYKASLAARCKATNVHSAKSFHQQTW